jgi:two-component system sensor histidine kinase and response regulator WspE
MSMLDLFRLETERQVDALTAGLLTLERSPADVVQLEACMRAAHSLKGAARIVGVTAGVSLAHALEDCFVAAQRGEITLHRNHIDLVLRGVDLIKRIAETSQERPGDWAGGQLREVEAYLSELALALAQSGIPDVPATVRAPELAAPEPAMPVGSSRALRVSAQRLNRVVGLAAESLVESRWVKPFSESLLRLKRRQSEATKAFDELCNALPVQTLDARAQTALQDVGSRIVEMHGFLSARLAEVEAYDRRCSNLAGRLYDDALACRMRPFAEGIAGLPRMVRDLSRTLGKDARLEIVGESMLLDRDILERLEAPLGHLLRNAIDHGVESPAERRAAGKTPEAVVLLEASHAAGMLLVTVSDDGRGVDLKALRKAIVSQRMATLETALTLGESELLEFLFLPGLSMKETVTEISGRGVGLDVVRDMVRRVEGTIVASTREGKGTRFQLVLPLSLSVVRTLLVEVGGEPYAFPLARIERTLKLRQDEVETLEGRRVFTFNGRPIGLVSAHELLRDGGYAQSSGDLSVIVVGEARGTYGIVADRFLGERELVVQPLDTRLGKLQDIAACALMEDGSPVLIVDIADLIRSLEHLVSSSSDAAQRNQDDAKRSKRVLVVDDSLTVRELERKILDNAGYEVEIAVNGMDGWNAVRSAPFDLVITDVDMPRLDGIELVGLIKSDLRLRSVPVIIVSYKDREEDQRRGLEAGADYFLSKASFHDETLLQSVVDLIGAAQA